MLLWSIYEFESRESLKLTYIVIRVSLQKCQIYSTDWHPEIARYRDTWMPFDHWCNHLSAETRKMQTQLKVQLHILLSEKNWFVFFLGGDLHWYIIWCRTTIAMDWVTTTQTKTGEAEIPSWRTAGSAKDREGIMTQTKIGQHERDD